MTRNGNTLKRPPISLQYSGSKGVLFRADCLDLLANISEGTIDCAFADPPFNLSKDYAIPDFADDMETEAYRSWCHAWLLELSRVLKPGGALFLYHWPKWLIDLGAWLNTLPALQYKSWIALKMKSGFPISGRLHPAHYGLLYYAKKGAKATFHVVRSQSPTCRHCGKLIRDYGGYRSKFTKFEDEHGIPWIQISDFWEDTRPARQDKTRLLINELPMHVPERAILLATNPGDIILDCFGGGGSTFHAAQQHQRYWIGGEIADSSAILARINAVFGAQERLPPANLVRCFKKPFRQRYLSGIRFTRDRPITKVVAPEKKMASLHEDASKSRILKSP